MPYGFIKHLENKGYSDETVKSYEKVVKQFFAYLFQTYNKDLEPFEINPSDIRNYIENQRDNDKSISTINKELTIIKTLFNYLWEHDKVALDPAMKIKRFVYENNPAIEITYDQLQDLLGKVLANPSYSSIRKSIFLLATKGLRTSDYRFKKDDVTDLKEANQVEIQLKNRRIVLNYPESSYFLEYFYETLFNEGDYVYITKPRGEDIVIPIQVMSILNHLRCISQDYLPKGAPSLTLVAIRRAIVFDLYTKGVSIQQIAHEMGIEEQSASLYIKYLVDGKVNGKKDLMIG